MGRSSLLVLGAAGLALARAQEPAGMPCTSEDYSMCPKYNITGQFAEIMETLDPNADGMYSCCIDNYCGTQEACQEFYEDFVNVIAGMFGLGVKAALGIIILHFVCCCCCISTCIYCCCCRKKRSGREMDYSGSGSSYSGSGSESEAEGPPLPKRQARLFLDALKAEYVQNRSGAVGNFHDDQTISANVTRQLDDTEGRVRDARNPKAEIERISREWGL
eukprot:TRINITY_DN31878_c0_g1_i1.p1 TRINITY_DN31878_c0_g1~~TRINITY_DN31878_c0_g1_i1.p1  ORF type:complete len:219 (-),score=45.94 TRINITY_DN31878_c0_g1_i1:53-709(-)